MATQTDFVPASTLLPSTAAAAAILPRDCTFTESDWRALAPFWYPVAFSHEVIDKPFAARLLDERVVVTGCRMERLRRREISAITVELR